VNRAHMAYDHGGLKALRRKPSGGRKSHLVHGVATTYFDQALGVHAINHFSTHSLASAHACDGP
jgi:hypothetical protein